MTSPDRLLASNRRLAQAHNAKHTTSDTDGGRLLKPVSSNFFYRRTPDDTSSSSSRPPRPSKRPSKSPGQKRKHTEAEDGTTGDSGVGVPWMLGRPMNSSRSSVADGFRGKAEQAEQSKRRKVLGEVNTNKSPPATTWKSSMYEDYVVDDDADFWDPANPMFAKKVKPIPLFMPSPSPKKPPATTTRTAKTPPAVTDDQADQLMRDLLQGLDDPTIGLFDDEILEDDLDEHGGKPLPNRGEAATETVSVKPEIGAEETVLEMHEWMKVEVDDPASKGSGPQEAISETRLGSSSKSQQRDEAENCDDDSEYADEFDYDAIDLDVLALVDASTNGTATPTALADAIHVQVEPVTTAAVYPIPHPPIHDSLSDSTNTYKPVPWQRCIVETVSCAPPPTAVQRFGNQQTTKILECRVVDSIASAVDSSPPHPAGSATRKIRCTLMGEWADLVLATGEWICPHNWIG